MHSLPACCLARLPGRSATLTSGGLRMVNQPRVVAFIAPAPRLSSMKLDTRSVTAFLRAPDPNVRAVLLYGPDEGKVRERGTEMARRIVPDLGDAFRVAEFPGSVLDDDPARLADEAAAIAMTGGRRVVRVRPAGNECAEAFARYFKH